MPIIEALISFNGVLLLTTMTHVLVIREFCIGALDVSSDIKFLFVLPSHPKLQRLLIQVPIIERLHFSLAFPTFPVVHNISVIGPCELNDPHVVNNCYSI